MVRVSTPNGSTDFDGDLDSLLMQEPSTHPLGVSSLNENHLNAVEGYIRMVEMTGNSVRVYLGEKDTPNMPLEKYPFLEYASQTKVEGLKQLFDVRRAAELSGKQVAIIRWGRESYIGISPLPDVNYSQKP
jgi:hypothetical protein